MSKLEILKEFLEFMKETRNWWLVPILVFLVLLGALILLTYGSTVAPFIYTLF